MVTFSATLYYMYDRIRDVINSHCTCSCVTGTISVNDTQYIYTTEKTCITRQPVAPERIWKWGAPVRSEKTPIQCEEP